MNFVTNASYCAVPRRVERAGAGREVERSGLAGDVGVAGRVDGDGQAVVDVESAEERRVDQRRASGVQLGNEGVVLIDAAARAGIDIERAIERAAGRRETRGLGLAGDVDVAGGVDGDRAAPVEIAPADERRVDERRCLPRSAW